MELNDLLARLDRSYDKNDCVRGFEIGFELGFLLNSENSEKVSELISYLECIARARFCKFVAVVTEIGKSIGCNYVEHVDISIRDTGFDDRADLVLGIALALKYSFGLYSMLSDCRDDLFLIDAARKSNEALILALKHPTVHKEEVLVLE